MTILQLESLGVISLAGALAIAMTLFYWPIRRAERRFERWAGLPEWSDRSERILRVVGVIVGIIGIGVGLFVFAAEYRSWT